MTTNNQRLPCILVTGFGPFPGVAVNVSAELAHNAAAIGCARRLDTSFITEILATEWARGLARIDELWATYEPIAALHLGVASDATGLVIERAAYNTCSLSVDASGQFPSDDLHGATTPPVRETTLPLDSLANALKREAIACSLSDNPGRYLCNAVYFRSLGHARMRGVPALFIHIPAWLVATQENSPPCEGSIDWASAARGIDIAVQALIDHAAEPTCR